MNIISACARRVACAGRGAAHRGMRTVAAILVTASLGACYDTEYKLTVRDNGSTAVDVEIRSDADMAEVFGIFEAFSELSPQAEPLKKGVCNAVAELAAANPAAQALNLRGKQGVTSGQTSGQFFCSIGADVGSITAMAQLATQDPTGAVDVKEVGPRTYSVTLDLAALPPMDTAELIKMAALTQAGALSQPGRPPLSPEVISNLADKSVAALLSVNRIIMRGRSVNLSISGRKIVETNGKVSPDGTTAVFSMSAEEFLDMLMKGDARQGKKFVAVVEY